MTGIRRGAPRHLAVAAALTVAALLLYLSLRGIAWLDVGQALAAAEPMKLAAAAAAVSVALWLRALRWRLLLNAEGSIGTGAVFRATAAGLFANSVLPARAGEVIRSMMVSSGTGLSTALVLTTALGERAVDAIVLATVSATVLLMLPSPPGWLAAAARPFAIAGLCGGAAIAGLPLLGSRMRHRTVQDVLRGLRAFHGPRRLGGFLGLTAVIWIADAAGTMIVASSIGLALSPPVALLLIAALALASAVPSTPGYLGVFQFVTVSVLTPFGVPRAQAIAYIVLAQALTLAVAGLWGAAALSPYRGSRPRLRDESSVTASHPTSSDSDIADTAKPG